MIQAAANTGFCPLHNLFCVQFLDSVELRLEWPLKAHLSYLPRRIVFRWLGLTQATPWSTVVPHPCPPPLSLKSRGRPVSTPHPGSKSSEPPGAGGGQAACDAALCTPWVGLPGLATEISRCSVPFEFQINDKSVFSVSRFYAVLGPTHTNTCSLFI